MSDKIKRLLADGVVNAAVDRRILLTPEEAVAYLGNVLTVQTLANRRMRGLRPRWVKLGSRIGYEIAELDDWVASCRQVLPDMTPVAHEAVELIALPDVPKRGRGRPKKVALAV